MTLRTRLWRWLLFTVILTAVLFGLAGRLDLPLFWAYAGVCAVCVLGASLKVDPTLPRERWRPGPGAVDRGLLALLRVFGLAHLVVATLDAGRFHWSDTVPIGLQVAALGGFAAALALPMWAMASNRFFSSVVRIQSERGHTVVTEGPYRYVRHPGYLGILIAIPCSALALGSWLALAPAVVFSALTVYRTAFEDWFLRANLGGYAGYVERVTYRLVPGVW